VLLQTSVLLYERPEFFKGRFRSLAVVFTPLV